ncbi:type II toxin-antitoxin system RelE family toxin [Roseiflexus sp. RS-1]|uniref:type II toxin-antitoxin system RelE family toxin n=1 Tax=Roseiflexus sp. (strain RS-1) TaxID=357808 RepID=UPI00059D82CA|nr:type II toxin-antitoxin system RelE/ParE family toxin [Roseiflexus sp. RS-1]
MAQVEFTESAQSDLARLDKPIAQRVLKKLRWLAENLEVVTPEALIGQWQGVFKLRVGDYRVLYTSDLEKQKIIVRFVRHRREVYKSRSE